MDRRAERLVVFEVGQQFYAVPLRHVTQVVAAAQWAPFPGAPAVVRGLLNFHGEAIPVFDPLQRLKGQSTRLLLSDQLLILDTQKRKVALLVNGVSGVVESSASTPLNQVPSELGSKQFSGAFAAHDGLVLIQDIDNFLSSNEVELLESAMERLSQPALAIR